MAVRCSARGFAGIVFLCAGFVVWVFLSHIMCLTNMTDFPEKNTKHRRDEILLHQDQHIRESNPTNSSYMGFPLVFHQIFLGYTSMPSAWPAYITHCQKLSSHWTYMLWDGPAVELLLAEDYPWFVKTYRGYGYDIQRADAARYFILHKYGGIYLDMDMKCSTSVDKFISAFHPTSPAVDNTPRETQCILALGDAKVVVQHLIVCKRRSDFMLHLISNLEDFDRWYILPYFTVMLSTGPVFVTSLLNVHRSRDAVTLVPRDKERSYFKDSVGRTWFSWDGYFLNRLVDVYIPWVIRHPVVTMATLAAAVVLVCLCVVAVRGGRGRCWLRRTLRSWKAGSLPSV